MAVSREQTDRQLTLMLEFSWFAVSLWRSICGGQLTWFALARTAERFFFRGKVKLTEANVCRVLPPQTFPVKHLTITRFK